MPAPATRDDSSFIQFRVKVPTDVRDKARGRMLLIELPAFGDEPAVTVTARVGEHVKFSLRTRDPAAAKVRHGAALVHVARAWDGLRSGPRPLTLREIVALSGDVYRLFLDECGDEPGDPNSWIAIKAFNRAVAQGRVIPVCLWFLARDKSNGLVRAAKLRDRRRETLFIDARGLGTMQGRTLKVLTEADVERVADCYHAWRETGGRHADEAGFSKAATTAEVAAQGYVLTPGRYVGTAEAEADEEPFEERMARLTATLREQTVEGRRLDERIRSALAGVGYGW